MKAYVVDTHVLVWYIDKDRRLSKKAEKILDSDDVILVFPTIVLAEIKYLFHKKRINLSLESVMGYLHLDPRCYIRTFDIPCVKALNTKLNLHDAAIVAVASVFEEMHSIETAVLSKDREIMNLTEIKVVW